jgi:hypothetical protein
MSDWTFRPYTLHSISTVMCVIGFQIQNTEYIANKLQNEKHFFHSDLHHVIAGKDSGFKIAGMITKETC